MKISCKALSYVRHYYRSVFTFEDISEWCSGNVIHQNVFTCIGSCSGQQATWSLITEEVSLDHYTHKVRGAAPIFTGQY